MNSKQRSRGSECADVGHVAEFHRSTRHEAAVTVEHETARTRVRCKRATRNGHRDTFIQGRDVDRLRRAGIEDDSSNVVGVFQARVNPGPTSVGRFVDAVAPGPTFRRCLC